MGCALDYTLCPLPAVALNDLLWHLSGYNHGLLLNNPVKPPLSDTHYQTMLSIYELFIYLFFCSYSGKIVVWQI